MKCLYKLALLVPTHYSDVVNYASICNTLVAAKLLPDDVQVVISDNSGVPEKRDFLQSQISGLENCKYLVGPLEKNHLHAWQHADAEFVLFAPDDDWLTPFSLKTVIDGLDGVTEDQVGFAGIYARALPGGYDHFYCDGLESKDFSVRLGALLNSIPKGNPLFHSIVRTDVMKDLLNIWYGAPNPQSWHDHLFTLLLVLKGGMLNPKVNFFIFNFGANWGAAATRIATEFRYLERFKYPPSIIVLSRLMLAFEGFRLILNFCNRNDLAARWFLTWFGLWKSAIGDYIQLQKVNDCEFFPVVFGLVKKYFNCSDIDGSEVAADISGLWEKVNGSGQEYLDFWVKR